MKTTAEAYFRKFPQRAVNVEQAREDRDAMSGMLVEIFRVLNRYDLIERRRP